ncbi:hypothetical protein MED01_002432 [Micromonospora sp. MED01]|uniref:hypothetical protein n=1 Tax=Micromonospora alfalfae TaxID=2911212 RepID=UPI001EE92565|nr:hypothetical protein [Micromonospora alfalfae]MCG5464266.1 hypothetical protein [Micromonospora alfalfae]
MTAFHTDVLALAQHARTSPNPDVRDAANRILTGDHALIAEPSRIEWANAITYGDGEVRYFDELDEEDARKHAAHDNRHRAKGREAGETDIAHATAVFREVRVLVDGTQIIGPWMAPADQFTEGR